MTLPPDAALALKVLLPRAAGGHILFKQDGLDPKGYATSYVTAVGLESAIRSAAALRHVRSTREAFERAAEERAQRKRQIHRELKPAEERASKYLSGLIDRHRLDEDWVRWPAVQAQFAADPARLEVVRMAMRWSLHALRNVHAHVITQDPLRPKPDLLEKGRGLSSIGGFEWESEPSSWPPLPVFDLKKAERASLHETFRLLASYQFEAEEIARLEDHFRDYSVYPPPVPAHRIVVPSVADLARRVSSEIEPQVRAAHPSLAGKPFSTKLYNAAFETFEVEQREDLNLNRSRYRKALGTEMSRQRGAVQG